MTLLLPAVAVSFAAFCIWLTVRIINRRERWAKWTAVVVALPILYVAIFGPVYLSLVYAATPIHMGGIPSAGYYWPANYCPSLFVPLNELDRALRPEVWKEVPPYPAPALDLIEN